MKKIKVAILGFGGIARAHYAGYLQLLDKKAPISVVAVLDCDPLQFDRPLRINIEGEQVRLDSSIHTYTDVDMLLANEDFDMADICLPSYLHKEYTVKMLRAGKHVLCEKPMALSSSECEEMIAASHESGKRLMVAQCLRFSPAYLYLKRCVEDGRFGKVKSLFMNRLCALPKWSFENWFQKTEKSGGCILDMHIHDVDMARAMFGEPQAVSTVSYGYDMDWQMENTRLFFSSVIAVINGSWDEASSTPFVSDFRAGFEKATLVKSADGILTVFPEEGEPFVPELEKLDMYAGEIEYFVNTILNGIPNTVNPPQSAAQSVRVIEALRESAALGGEKINYIPYNF